MSKDLVRRCCARSSRRWVTHSMTSVVALAALLSVSIGLSTPAVAQGVVDATACGPGGGNFGDQLLNSAWPGGFTGVPVYCNGPDAAYDGGCTNSATYAPTGAPIPTGTEWQCVELVNRLHVTKGRINTTWHGDGDVIGFGEVLLVKSQRMVYEVAVLAST
jgi:hypothetical protein